MTDLASVRLLLPERARFGGQRLPESSARWLGRADRSQRSGDWLEGVFDILPRGWPVAAATRQRDAGDAAGAAWLRADPAHIRPDINGARLLAYGDALGLSTQDAAALLRPLRPLFGDAGFPIEAPVPSRWYVRLPIGAKLPVFTDPHTALGADVFEHLPEDAAHATGEGRRWRALLSESQVLLHNHPLNAQRVEAGRAPVNSLWFWGAGMLPDHVRSDLTSIHSDDEALQAFAALAGVHAAPLPPAWQPGRGVRLLDLRALRDLAQLDAHWLAPLLADFGRGGATSLLLDFADGLRLSLRPAHRWRFWRPPLRSLQS